MVSDNRFTWKDIKISGFTLKNIGSTDSFTWAKLFLQAGLPEEILLALTDFVGWVLIALTALLKQTLFLQTGLPKQILLALTDFVQWTLTELPERALITLIVLLEQT